MRKSKTATIEDRLTVSFGVKGLQVSDGEVQRVKLVMSDAEILLTESQAVSLANEILARLGPRKRG
jgi:hypothetical protein